MSAEPAPQGKDPSGENVLLYQSAVKIYPRQAKGRFARLRLVSMLGLLGIYYLTPWLQWDGRPLVLFDLPHRRFHVFTLTLVPQDLLLLALLLLLMALTLFLFTSLAGRLWCGYACPQTVWTEAFLWIEQLCEGDRYNRIKLDRAPWSAEKALRKGGKHLLWLALGLFTGLSFVSYFVPARQLFVQALTLQLSGWPLFWSLFYGFATWGNGGFMREQVCKYMCPYARFQSAMFDRDTLIIAYDEHRGEPRKSLARKNGQAAADCVDCSLCVQVCPMGIDIRHGLQYECIACAACVDACDAVMGSVDKPRGLIRYTSSRHDAGGKFHLFRARTLGYGLVWSAACCAFMFLVFTHSPVRFDVLRDRHALYREMADGSIENVYTLKVTNDDEQLHRYTVSARLADGTPLAVEPAVLEREAEQTGATTVTLRTPPRAADAAALPMVEHAVVQLDQEGAANVSKTRSASFLTGGKS